MLAGPSLDVQNFLIIFRGDFLVDWARVLEQHRHFIDAGREIRQTFDSHERLVAHLKPLRDISDRNEAVPYHAQHLAALEAERAVVMNGNLDFSLGDFFHLVGEFLSRLRVEIARGPLHRQVPLFSGRCGQGVTYGAKSPSAVRSPAFS